MVISSEIINVPKSNSSTLSHFVGTLAKMNKETYSQNLYKKEHKNVFPFQ